VTRRAPMPLAGLAMLLLLPAMCVHAHDVHQSRAEAEFNTGAQRLEVSLTVFVADLEFALTRQAERRMSLTSSPAPEVDAQLLRCLKANFIVTDAGGKVADLHWVGRQLDAATAASAEPEVTLFFEVSLPEGLGGCSLRHVLFCDRFEDQCNLLHFRSGAQSTGLKFSRDEPVRALTEGK
jgi:hypothetical protein